MGIKNYLELFKNPAFLLSIQNTLRFWAVGISLNLLLGILLALLCRFMGGKRLQAILFWPAVVPAACAVALAQLWLDEPGFFLSVGAFGRGAMHSWRSSEASFYVLVILFLWKTTGYTVVLLFAALTSVSREVVEAAILDGAGPVRRFFRVELPLIRPAIALSVLIAVINSFKSFREAYLIGGAYPHDTLYSLQHFLQNNIENINYARAAAASVLILLLVAGLCALAANLPDHNLPWEMEDEKKR